MCFSILLHGTALRVPFLPSAVPRIKIFSTLMASSTSSIQQGVRGTGASTNWRVLPQEDSFEEFLQNRTEWSSEAYEDSLQLYDHFMECADSYIAGPIQSALNSLDHAFRLYRPESVICSFNGGKDAVVILHLMRASQAHYYKETNSLKRPRPRVIYFEHPDEFPQVRSFVQDSVRDFDLDMIAFPEGTKYSTGLRIFVEHNKLPGTGENTPAFPLAFVLGTRENDPNAGSQGVFAPSSHYMPPFMRVNPILDWSYGLVWHFLRLFHLPYCSLYDEGYTSLGTTKDTHPCPALLIPGASDGLPRYWPAYMLRDYDQERAGRLSKDQVKRLSDDSESVLSHTNSSVTNFSNATKFRPLANDDSVVSYTEDSIQKRVGLLIIGDEILKGLMADLNTATAAKALRAQNVLLERVVIVSDNSEEIVREINRLQNEVDVIITSGGVGPTHDDVTIKSVARAVGVDLVLHSEMAELLQEKMNTTELTDAQKKMATLPSTAKLRYLSDNPSDWPVLQCRNIFILPGIPEIFEKKIDNVANYLSCQLKRGTTYKVLLSVDENSIVSVLNKVVENHPMVSIGSYPFLNRSGFKTVITLEKQLNTSTSLRNSAIFDLDSIDMDPISMDHSVEKALDDLIRLLPEGSVLRVEEDMTMFASDL